jgi:hypothetical protein
MDLKNTSIDFDDLVAELEADLQTRESFKALFPGETSRIFTEHGAAITALMLYHIHSATQNAFFPTAFSKQAVYALATSLGNPPRRKLGAELDLLVTINTILTTNVTLPKFSRFSGRSLEWYTVSDTVLPAGPAGQTLLIKVRQGERITETFTGNGKGNQRIEVGENFNLDENFLEVSVDNTLYTKSGSSLLNVSAGDTVYAEQTDSSGRVLIIFGTNILGTIPALGSTIDISYANTVGFSSNSSITGDTFDYLEIFDLGGGNFLDISAVANSTASGGSNEETVEQVKNTAPKLYAANQRAVRRSDYIGHLLRITGAFSASAWGEYEEAQQKGYADLTMMNRAYVTAIPPVLNDQNEIPVVGDGVTTSVSSSISPNVQPGSIIVSSDTATWYDYDGKGLLMSPNVSFNEVGGGTANASENPGTANLAWDGNLANSWQSATLPTTLNPVRLTYDFGAGNEKQIRSVRIASSGDPLLTDRGFPRQVSILASNLTSPDPSNRDDWEVIRGITLLDEAGFQAYSRWIPVDDITNTTAYRHVAIEILEIYGTSSVSKISSVEVQDSSNDSTINYETGAFSLIYGSAPTGDITFDFLNGNFTTAQKDGILEELNDLNHFTTLIEYRDSVAVPMDVVATVYHLEGYAPSTILANVQSAISDLFLIRSDTIGKPLYLSDIYQAIQDIDGVDYTLLSAPTLDKIVEIDQFVILNSQTITVLPTNR